MNQLRRPLVAVLFPFLAALALSLRFALPPPLSVLIFVALLFWTGMAGMTRGRQRDEGVVIVGLFAGAGLLLGSLGVARATSDCRTTLEDGGRLQVEGRLGAAHRIAAEGERPPLLPLVEAVINEPPGCRGELRIRMPANHPPVAPGTAVVLRGEWRTFANPVSPSRWPRDPLYLGFLRADSVLVADAEAPSSAAPWLLARARADRVFDRIFPNHHALVEALLLGRREYVDQATIDRFATSGLTHLLAISGSHVALFAAALLLLGSALRLTRRASSLLTLATTWFYILVIGAPASAVRAACMITVVLAAVLLQRPSAAGPIIAFAAFAILAFRPLALLDPGFQLSFLGVIGILAFRRPLLSLVPAAAVGRPWSRALVDAVVIGVAAFAATAPVVAHHFGIIAPVSIVAGVPAVPLTSLALVGTVVAVGLHPLIPPLARLVADGTALTLDLIDWIAGVAAAVPFGHAAVSGPPWWSWGVALGTALALGRSRVFATDRLRVITATGAASVVVIFWPIAARALPQPLEIHFIDVGQGDAIALRTPRARWILVDTGPASPEFDAGERRVLPFLRDRGARRLAVLVLTHPDLDHIGGAPAVIRGLPVTLLFEPGLPVGKAPYLDVLREVVAEEVDWHAARSGRTLQIDGIDFEFLWPDPQTVDAAQDANQISAILRVTYGDFSMLLTGDAGAEVEEVLVERHGTRLESDLLKLGHHGSATSSSAVFLDTVDPELAIVSAGRRNRYGHPAASVVTSLVERGIPMARTDRDGTITVKVGAGGKAWGREEG